MQKFKIEAVLAVLTGVSFERGLYSANSLIEYMTNEPANELTWLDGQRVSICKQEILSQYPEARLFTQKEIDGTNVEIIRQEAIAQLGAEIKPHFLIYNCL